MAHFVIRRAAPGDADEAASIVRIAFEPYIARIGRKPAPMLSDYRQLIRDGAVDVAIDARGMIGVIVLLPAEDSLYLDTVAVSTRVRGHGVGRALIAHAEAEARRRGYHAVTLLTNAAMTENVAMYLRLGYNITGQETQEGFNRVFFRKEL